MNDKDRDSRVWMWRFGIITFAMFLLEQVSTLPGQLEGRVHLCHYFAVVAFLGPWNFLVAPLAFSTTKSIALQAAVFGTNILIALTYGVVLVLMSRKLPVPAGAVLVSMLGLHLFTRTPWGLWECGP